MAWDRLVEKSVDGVVYHRHEGDEDPAFNDVFWTTEEYGHYMLCECGNNSFHVFNNGEYDTSARCTKCGATDTVHSG